MVLKKDKIYKVRHNFISSESYIKNTIIFSPTENIVLQDGFFQGSAYKYTGQMYNKCRHIDTHFTVCFDRKIVTKFDLDRYGNQCHSHTGVDPSCELVDNFTNEDYESIKKAIGILGNNYRYNRKLNKLIYESN